MKNSILSLVLFLLPFLYTFAQQEESKAFEVVQNAVQLMDDGHVDESIKLLKEILNTTPNCYICKYELAYAYTLKQDYREVVNILKKLEKHKEATDLLYQMLGNAYDYMGNSNNAMKTYKRGLKKFKNSGRLYLEQGVVQMGKNEYDKALDYFKKGIEVEPMFPSNYYWTARLFCNSDEEVWGMIYGEIFMNLERNTRRTSEISKLLYDTYESEIQITDNAISVSFSKNNTIYFNPKDIISLKIPFGIGIYEPTLLSSIVSEKTININTLDSIRTRFVDLYFENSNQEKYPNILFNYQKQVKDAGHLSAYNHWILMQGDNTAFEEWHTDNEEKWDNFVDWFIQNPMKISF